MNKHPIPFVFPISIRILSPPPRPRFRPPEQTPLRSTVSHTRVVIHPEHRRRRILPPLRRKIHVRQNIRRIHQDREPRHHPLPPVDGPLHGHRAQAPVDLRVVHDRVLHRRPRRPHALHGDHPHPRRFRRRRVRTQLDNHAVRAVLRDDARARPSPREGVRPRRRPPRGDGPRGEHQRGTGEQPVHVHRQGERRAQRADDDGDDRGGDTDDAVFVQGDARRGGAGGREGDRRLDLPGE